jgi:hypothetical protein
MLPPRKQLLIALGLLVSSAASAQSLVRVPLHCSQGDANQIFNASVTAPKSGASGSRLHIRIDGRSSGTISHFGLHYLHHMITEYTLPRGARYIEGSARLVPGTGSANVRAGATIRRVGRKLRLALPSHVDNGTSYTPPSIEFDLSPTAAAGTKLKLEFSGYWLVANATMVGDVATSCAPIPNPYVMDTVLVTK